MAKQDVDFIGSIELKVEGDRIDVYFNAADGSRMIHFAPQSLRALQQGGVTLKLGPVKMAATIELLP